MSMMKKSACIWNSSVKNLKIKTQCVILNARWSWFALGGMLLYPFAVVVASLADLDNAQKTLGDMANIFCSSCWYCCRLLWSSGIHEEMIYFDLNTRLHPTQAEALLNLEHSFWDHQTHGDDTNLDIALLEDESLNGEIRSMFQVEPTVVTMMRIQAGKEVVPHVDNPEHRRLSSVVFPLKQLW